MAIPSHLRRAATTLREQRSPTGIALPVRLDPAGRIETTTGAAQTASLLARALQSNANECPQLQGRGLGEAAVFLPNVRSTWGVVEAGIERVIREEFAGRLRLISVSFEAGVGDTVAASVAYRDLTTNTIERVALTLRAG